MAFDLAGTGHPPKNIAFNHDAMTFKPTKSRVALLTENSTTDATDATVAIASKPCPCKDTRA